MMTLRDDEGMGMESFTFAGRTCYGHTGGSANSGAWLAYCPEERLALAYTTNMKVYPFPASSAASSDIYWNRPFEIPAFEVVEVSPDILERYVGVYLHRGRAGKNDDYRRGGTLYIQPPGEIRGAAGGRDPESVQDRSGRVFYLRRRERND
jgi:hypothetical protein